MEVELSQNAARSTCAPAYAPAPDARKMIRYDQVQEGDLPPTGQYTSFLPMWHVKSFFKRQYFGYQTVEDALSAGMLGKAETDLVDIEDPVCGDDDEAPQSWRLSWSLVCILGALVAASGCVLLLCRTSFEGFDGRDSMAPASAADLQKRVRNLDGPQRYPSYHRGWVVTASIDCGPKTSYARMFSTTTSSTGTTQTRTTTTRVTTTETTTTVERKTTRRTTSTQVTTTTQPTTTVAEKKTTTVAETTTTGDTAGRGDDWNHDFFKAHSLLDAAALTSTTLPSTTSTSTTLDPTSTTMPEATTKLEYPVLQALLVIPNATTRSHCRGKIEVAGHGQVSIVAAEWNFPGERATDVRASGAALMPRMGARAYFADECEDGADFDGKRYMSLRLLGRKLKYTVDLSEAHCGCNAAFYLVPMARNNDPSKCNDYYCDATSVCGVACAEIDVQEGNIHAWHSTLHSSTDVAGLTVGYGGGDMSYNSARDWSNKSYAPNDQACINTLYPFEVEASFPKDRAGHLSAMVIRLSQTRPGRSCQTSANITSYANIPEISRALAEGVTPVASYWSNKNMLWLDGLGADGDGPCARDAPDACGDFSRFSDFAVEDLN